MGKKKPRAIQKIMVEATRLHSSGQVVEAAALYRSVIASDAKHAEANHLLGLTMHQRGDSEQALSYMKRGIDFNPKDPGYYSNYGSALKAVGRLEEAVESYETAMLLDPHFLAAPYNAGEVYCMLERFDDGERVYRRALEIKSDVSDIWSNLGICLVKKEQWGDAIESLERSLELNAGNASSHFSLGYAHDQQEYFEKARDSVEQAMRLGHPEGECRLLLASICETEGKPQQVVEHLERLVALGEMSDEAYLSLAQAYQKLGFREKTYDALEQVFLIEPMATDALCLKSSLLIEDACFEEAGRIANKAAFSDRSSEVAYSHLGRAYRGLSRLSDAREAYEEAINLNPTRAENYNNLALVLSQLALFEEMERSYKKALEFNPDYASCMSNYATALIVQGRLSEAEALLLRAIELDDTHPFFWENLGRVRYEQGDFDGSRQAYVDAMTRNNGNPQSKVVLAANQIASDKIDDATLFQYHSDASEAVLASIISEEATSLDLQACVENASQRGKLRLGFVSSDFKVHSVAYFLFPLFEQLDRTRFEIYCYSGVSCSDHMTAKFEALANGWRMIAEQPSSLTASSIREDQIDVLFDLTGYTAGNALDVFARKPAPVQVAWLGYAHSTALEQMDYRIVDEDTDPEGVTLNTEKLVRLPGSFISYNAAGELPDVAPPPSVASGSVRFGSFNNIVKLSETTVGLFAGALLAVKGSRLILKSHQTADVKVQKRIFNLFAERGVERERIQLLPRYNSMREHLESYGQVDIALDTYPYNGTTTTCEALAMGVPVVTLAGTRHAARVGCSLMRSVNLPDLVAETPEDFAVAAKRLAENSERLIELRYGLRRSLAISPLGNAKVFTDNMEAAIEGMWSGFSDLTNGASLKPRLDAVAAGAKVSDLSIKKMDTDNLNTVWVASYPRSGNTLLRTILWQCFNLKSASIYSRDLGNNKDLEGYVGHIEHGPDQKIQFPKNTVPLVKTHEYPKDNSPAIYVIRDGRAACVSLRTFYGGSHSLEVIASGGHKFGTWAAHVQAWDPWNRPNTLLVKYEDMLNDLPKVLVDICAFLGREIVNDSIPNRDEIAGTDGRWVRTRKNWRDAFSDEFLERFNEANRMTLRKTGYIE